ncbi:acyloxyacyl hydrolase [Achromobacter insolitus]|uniref:acyloxyacyl hydrolase n=1 Tax=Achromobacter insolitus TaxID=217204 RepID=UPI001EEEC1C0|nr:acyloxyacyl hydrolase [Achromobacter insolitus]
MNTNKDKLTQRKLQRKILVPALLSLVLAGAGAEAAANSVGTKGGVSLHYGVGEHYKRYTLNYETSPLWSTEFSGSWGRLDLTPELGASYWTADGSRSPGNVWQFSAIPMFRWWTSERFYIETGIGATVFTRTRFAEKNIGSAFQFGDHIGAGFLLTPNNRIGLRYSHFSNAGIKRPNPGLDTVQVTYTYQF